MERKNKIWIIILAILLALAIAAVILFNSRLNGSQATLAAANTDLQEAQQKNAELTASLEDVNAQLTAEQEAKSALEGALADEKERMTSLQGELDAAQEEKAALQSDLEQVNGENAEIRAELDALKTAEDEYQSRIAELEGYIEEADEKIADLNQEMEAAQGQLIDLGEGQTDNAVNPVLQTEPAAIEAPEAPVAAMPDRDVTAVPVSENPAEGVESSESAAATPDRDVTAVSVSENPAEGIEATESELESENAEILAICDEIMGIVNDEASDKTDTEKAADLNDLKTQLTGYIDELKAQEAQVIAHETELEAALQTSEESCATLQTSLQDAQTQVDALSRQVEQGQDQIAKLEADLAQANADYEALSVEKDALSADYDALSEEKNALSADYDALSEEKDALSADYDALSEEKDALSADYDALSEDYAAQTKELNTYKYARDPQDGEAHSASSFDHLIEVEADGRTASGYFVNNTISGNDAVLVIRLGDQEIYTSKALKPGEALESFRFSEALSAGEYDAMAITKVFEANGDFASSTSVPVKIHVAE